MESAKKRAKRHVYLNKVKEIEKSNKEMGIPRVQDVSKAIQIRTRQNNFGISSFNFPSNRAASWKPTTEMLVSTKSWECYVPDQNGNQRRRWIRNSKDLVELKKRLLLCSEFALDTEANSYDSRLGFICLIQISTWKYGDFLIGAIELHAEITKYLKDVLEDPTILKIMHGCENDVTWMQKDFGIYIQGVADTQEFVSIWKGKRAIAYSELCHKFYPQFDYLSNSSTISNWSLRPEMGMSPEQQDYAVNDVHLLLRMFDQIRYGMRNDKYGMRQAFEKSNDKTKQLFHRPNTELQDSKDVFYHVMEVLNNKQAYTKDGLTAAEMPQEQRRTLRALIEWRFLFARIVDKKDDSLLAPLKLFRLADLRNPTRNDIHRIVGDVGLIAECQKEIIFKLLTREDQPTYIRHLKTLECHNCLTCGHGPASFCPFPRNPNAIYIWLLRNENDYYLRKRFDNQNQIRKERNKAELTWAEYLRLIKHLATRSN